MRQFRRLFEAQCAHLRGMLNGVPVHPQQTGNRAVAERRLSPDQVLDRN
jgi:hypothetical protein